MRTKMYLSIYTKAVKLCYEKEYTVPQIARMEKMQYNQSRYSRKRGYYNLLNTCIAIVESFLGNHLIITEIQKLAIKVKLGFFQNNYLNIYNKSFQQARFVGKQGINWFLHRLPLLCMDHIDDYSLMIIEFEEKISHAAKQP